jgi:hypothetical protein
MRRSFNIVAAHSDLHMRDNYQELLSSLGHHVTLWLTRPLIPGSPATPPVPPTTRSHEWLS